MSSVSRVDQVTRDAVTVEGAAREQRRRLKALGGRSSLFRPSRLTFAFSGERELAEVLTRLRDVGLPMMGGVHGWPPGERFRQLRDQGLVTGDFDEVVWLGPGRPQITKR